MAVNIRTLLLAIINHGIKSYCYDKGIRDNDRIFPINRSRVFQIVQKTMKLAGLNKPEGVGTVHVLRHSGALERLRLIW